MPPKTRDALAAMMEALPRLRRPGNDAMPSIIMLAANAVREQSAEYNRLDEAEVTIPDRAGAEGAARSKALMDRMKRVDGTMTELCRIIVDEKPANAAEALLQAIASTLVVRSAAGDSDRAEHLADTIDRSISAAVAVLAGELGIDPTEHIGASLLCGKWEPKRPASKSSTMAPAAPASTGGMLAEYGRLWRTLAQQEQELFRAQARAYEAGEDFERCSAALKAASDQRDAIEAAIFAAPGATIADAVVKMDAFWTSMVIMEDGSNAVPFVFDPESPPTAADSPTLDRLWDIMRTLKAAAGNAAASTKVTAP